MLDMDRVRFTSHCLVLVLMTICVYGDVHNQGQNLTVADRLAALEADMMAVRYQPSALTASQINAQAGRSPCVLGSHYQFNEYPNRYGNGIPHVQPRVNTAQGCLDACRRHSGCVAASVSTRSHTCQLYTKLPTSVSQSHKWNYYVLDHTKGCPVVGVPIIEFYAELCRGGSFGYNQRVIWDTVVINKGDGFHKDDGAFHCPVLGVYAFTVNIMSHPGPCKQYARYHFKDENGIGVGQVLANTCNWLTATNTIYRRCGPGQTIHLHSMKAHNGVLAVCKDHHQTNFSGRLVSTI